MYSGICSRVAGEVGPYTRSIPCATPPKDRKQMTV